MNCLLNLRTKISRNMLKRQRVLCRKNQKTKRNKNNRQKMDKNQPKYKRK